MRIVVYWCFFFTEHRIEHIWPEVSQQVYYPIKALVELVDAGQLDIDDKFMKYCVSNLGLELSEILSSTQS